MTLIFVLTKMASLDPTVNPFTPPTEPEMAVASPATNPIEPAETGQPLSITLLMKELLPDHKLVYKSRNLTIYKVGPAVRD
jgi:hypothetical protein